MRLLFIECGCYFYTLASTATAAAAGGVTQVKEVDRSKLVERKNNVEQAAKTSEWREKEKSIAN